MYVSLSFQGKTCLGWSAVSKSRESINARAASRGWQWRRPPPPFPWTCPPCNSPIWSNSRSPPQAAGTPCGARSAPASPWWWMTSGHPPPPPGSRSHRRSAPSLPPPRRGSYFWRRYWWPARREVRVDQMNRTRPGAEALIKLVN